jgi:hypothetical protein
MGTGACGINCTVCRLHVQGICSSCGAGTSEAGRLKLEAQGRLFGQACPVLRCAVDRRVGYCLRGCDEFPCEHFSSGPYPFAQGFLQMQARRRAQHGRDLQAAWPERTPEFWDALGERDPNVVCHHTGAIRAAEGGFTLQCLRETWAVDPDAQTIQKVQGTFGGEWDRQLPFLILVYLVSASDEPLTGEMVAPRELYPGVDVFQGHHALTLGDLESRYGRDGAAFGRAAERLGGMSLEGGDVAARFNIFPKLPVDYLLWLADEEFGARLTLLLDRGTARHYPADTLAVAVNLLTQRLLQEQPED